MELHIGQIVELIVPEGDDRADFAGLQCKVRDVVSSSLQDLVLLEPLQDRPDGVGRSPFFWLSENVRGVQ